MDLGLTDEEFWRLTPRELDALSKRTVARRDREDYQVALLCAVIANTAPRRRKRPFKPEDFLPKRRARTRQTPEQMLRVIEMLNAALGGQDLRGQKEVTLDGSGRGNSKAGS